MRSWFIVHPLWDCATMMAEYHGGRAEVFVEYRDTPWEGVRPFRIQVGEFDGLEIRAFNEMQESLKDVRESAGEEGWKRFMEELRKAFVMAEVMES